MYKHTRVAFFVPSLLVWVPRAISCNTMWACSNTCTFEVRWCVSREVRESVEAPSTNMKSPRNLCMNFAAVSG